MQHESNQKRTHTHGSKTCIAYKTYTCIRFLFGQVQVQYQLATSARRGASSRGAIFGRVFLSRFLLFQFYILSTFQIREDFKSNCVSVKELFNQQKQQT